jgi:hypothetical protein
VRAQNMVMVGAAAPLLKLDYDSMLKFVEALFSRKGDKVIAVNRKAFDYGVRAGEFFRGLVDAGFDPLDALKIAGKMVPETYDRTQAEAWRAALSGDGGLEKLLGAGEDVDCGDHGSFS